VRLLKITYLIYPSSSTMHVKTRAQLAKLDQDLGEDFQAIIWACSAQVQRRAPSNSAGPHPQDFPIMIVNQGPTADDQGQRCISALFVTRAVVLYMYRHYGCQSSCFSWNKTTAYPSM